MMIALGLLIMCIPFLALFIHTGLRYGWSESLTVFGMVGAIIVGVGACVALGMYCIYLGVN